MPLTGKYQPTARGLQMLVSLHTTGDEEAYLKAMGPYQAQFCGHQAYRVRNALIEHGLMAHTRARGIHLTPRGRLLAAKHERAQRKPRRVARDLTAVASPCHPVTLSPCHPQP